MSPISIYHQIITKKESLHIYITCIRKNKEYYTIAITNHIYMYVMNLKINVQDGRHIVPTIITLTEVIKQSYTCYMQAAN